MRGVGLPSGVEYAALGFVLGPARPRPGRRRQPRGRSSRSSRSRSAGSPSSIGLDFGFAGDKRVRPGSLALGTLSALLTGGAVGRGRVVRDAIASTSAASTTERILLAGGVGAACSQTTRHAVRWIVDRHERAGPLADRHQRDRARRRLLPAPRRGRPLRPRADARRRHEGAAARLARDHHRPRALLMGAGAALLLRSEMPMEDTWAVLFGVSLIAIGTATRLALSDAHRVLLHGHRGVGALEPPGASSARWSGPTERPVLLPALVLAGARIDFRASPALPWIAAAAIAARLVAKIVDRLAARRGLAPGAQGGAARRACRSCRRARSRCASAWPSRCASRASSATRCSSIAALVGDGRRVRRPDPPAPRARSRRRDSRCEGIAVDDTALHRRGQREGRRPMSARGGASVERGRRARRGVGVAPHAPASCSAASARSSST